MPQKKEPLSELLLKALTKISQPSQRFGNSYYADINRFRAFGLIPLGFTSSNYSRTVSRLSKNNLIETRHKGPKIEIRITQKGLDFLKRKEITNVSINKTKWDRLWRVAIFDIPEKDKKLRDSFRGHLKRLGFIQVQKSVWVCPYPCQDQLIAISRLHKVEPFVTLLEGKYIGNDRPLREIFKI